ncbi:MAG: M23 family metallopeptidase, partial [Dehalococcoidia bacterium]
TPTSTPTPTPQPVLQTATLEVAQGGAAVLRVSAVAASAVATFEERAIPLSAKSDGFWGVVGVGADHASGSFPLTVTFFDDAGASFGTMTGTVVVYDRDYPVEFLYLDPDTSSLLDPALSAQEQAVRSSIFGAVTAERLWSGTFLYPSTGPISSPYGIGRSYNDGPVTGFHHGTDFQADEGGLVVASNAGRVVYADALPIRGLSVIIDHGAGVFTGYHHLSGATVSVGQSVAPGDLVGYVGASGLATGSHLHWELVVNGVEVDPILWTVDEYGP